MTIDWQAFTPWSSLAGGLLIGIAASAFVLLNGRIAGISGVLGGLLRPASGEWPWRLAFLTGLLAAPWLFRFADALPATRIEAGTPALVLAGLLVGYGTRLGAGCTSGHGVCGISRGSPRSVLATGCFMAAGFATVYIVRHLLPQ